ncbi:MAG: hypothetical protein AB1516_06155 [Pseudomonadota bacterium]
MATMQIEPVSCPKYLMITFSISESVPVAKQPNGSFHFSLQSVGAKLKLLDPKLPLFCMYETLFCEAIQQVTGQQLKVEWRTTFRLSQQQNELVFYQTVCIPELNDQDHLAKVIQIVQQILSKPDENNQDQVEYNQESTSSPYERTQVTYAERPVLEYQQESLSLEEPSLNDLTYDCTKLVEAVENAADIKFRETQEKLPQNKNKSTIQSVIPSHTVIINQPANNSASQVRSEIKQPCKFKKIERENVVAQVMIQGALIGTDWVRRPPTTKSNRRSKITIECIVNKSEAQASLEQIDSIESDGFEAVTVLVPHALEISGECDLLKESFPQQDRDQGSARKITVVAEKSSCSGELVLIRVLEVK